MKKLAVVLSLFSIVSLQAAGAAQDDFSAEEYERALAMSRQLPARHDTTVKLSSSDGKTVHLPFSTNNPEDNMFETINNLVDDLGLEDDHSIPIPTSSENLKHAISLYTDHNYQLPVTDQEQRTQGVTLQGILKTLDFLDAKDLTKKFYTTWLNHPQNENGAVHHNAPVATIFNQMGLDTKNLPSTLINTNIALKKEDTNNINNYANRKLAHMSIQNLIDANKINIENNKLDLSGKGIVSLEGLSNLPNTIIILRLKNNKITIIPPQAFAGLSNLLSLHLSNNKISTIPVQAFAGLNNLTVLNLSNNKIAKIPVQAFAGLNNLEYLALNYNQIATIPAQEFADLNYLEHLFISNNQLNQEQKDQIKTQVPANCFIK